MPPSFRRCGLVSRRNGSPFWEGWLCSKRSRASWRCWFLRSLCRWRLRPRLSTGSRTARRPIPVWTYFLAGANMWAKDTGQTVKTSFHNGDVASQQEAIRAAIAAKADGIVTTQPRSGQPGRGRQGGARRGHSDHQLQHAGPEGRTSTLMSAATSRSSARAGRNISSTTSLVKSGDFVWMPVEVPGASYGVEEEQAIASVFKPLGITWEVTDDDARSGERHLPHERLSHRQPQEDQGDHRPRRSRHRLIKRVFDQVGVKPGEIPVVGWGNSRDTTQRSAATATSTPASGRTRRRRATWRCRSPRWRRAAFRPGFNITRRRALRQGHGVASTTRSCPASRPQLGRARPSTTTAQAGGFTSTKRAPPADEDAWPTRRLPRPSSTWRARKQARSCATLIARARVRPVRAARRSSLRSSAAINPDFLSALNISNTLTFTVELGLIALAMTLLMTAGEFDLSVGSLFGFAPVLMWTLFNGGLDLAERRIRRQPGRGGADRARQRPVRDAAQDPVVPGHARHAAGGARHGAVRHRRLPAAHLERRRAMAGECPGRRLLHRLVPGLRVAVLVRRLPRSCSATC